MEVPLTWILDNDQQGLQKTNIIGKWSLPPLSVTLKTLLMN